jgi:hypothetical protein
MWKLGFNVATFALFYSFQMAWSTYMLVINRDNCLVVDHRKVVTVTLYGWLRNIMLLRIIADPVVSFFTDSQVFDLKTSVSVPPSAALSRVARRLRRLEYFIVRFYYLDISNFAARLFLQLK